MPRVQQTICLRWFVHLHAVYGWGCESQGIYTEELNLLQGEDACVT